MTDNHITVDLVEGDPYYRDSYGIVLVSETQHTFAGRGVHNQGLRHVLQVWDNTVRPAKDGSGLLIGPRGENTSDRYSFRWSPQMTIIALQPHPQGTQGPALTLGDLVTLRILGFEIGTFQCRAKPFDNPHMVKVDTSSSASRQHYIDTGEYLAVEE